MRSVCAWVTLLAAAVLLLAASGANAAAPAAPAAALQPTTAPAAAAVQPVAAVTPAAAKVAVPVAPAVAAAGASNGGVPFSPAKRVGSALGSYYHSTRELYDAIKAIAARCAHMTLSWERAPLSVDPAQSQSLLAVRLNLDPSRPKSERALLLFGEHARELISPETGLEFLRRACDPKLLDAKMSGVDASLREILSRTEFVVFPNANPSGRRLTEKGQYCNRVNARGVDINRNWGEHWSAKFDHPDTNPGARAWSEPETVILAHAAARLRPTIFISVHSGTLNMLAPFAFDASQPGEPAASTTAQDPPGLPSAAAVQLLASARDSLRGTGVEPVLRVLKHVNEDFCRCPVGAAGKELGYLSPGTCIDYIYNRLGTRYAFAVEIYSGKQYAKPRRTPKRVRAPPRVLIEHSAEVDAELDADSDSEADSEADDALEVDDAADMELDAETEVDAESEAEADSDAEAEAEAEEQAAALLQLAEEEFENRQSLMEVQSEFFTRQPDSFASAFPSFDLPSFTELDSAAHSSAAELLNDGDVPESSDVLFPRTTSGKQRACLVGFNPVTLPMYQRTVDHWSRALFAFVNTIAVTRPQ